MTLNVLENELVSHECVKKYGFAEFSELGLLTDKGKVRLAPAQRYFNENENYFPLLLDLFDVWRAESEYMVFKHEEDGKTLYLASKCSKRGNDVYVSRVKRRFKHIVSGVDDHKFFDVNDFKVDCVVHTRLLWITLTYDSRRSSVRHAWQNIGVEYNRWISAVRRRYGKVSVLRSWETSGRGYPHIHAVLAFEDAEFRVFPHFNMNQGRMTYRIQEKGEFESLWHSFTDIEAISSTRKLFHYVAKYQLKVNEGREEAPRGQESCKTLAFMWLFRKRSFSVSGSFIELFSRLDRDLHNSNMESKEKWELVGIFPGRDLGLNGEWFAEVEFSALKPLLLDGDPRVDGGKYGEDGGISTWDESSFYGHQADSLGSEEAS